MLHNDISNKQAPILAFNVDNLLFKEEQGESSIIDRVKNLIQSDRKKYINRDIDMTFVNMINNIWMKHPYSIYLITFSPYKDDLFNILDKNLVNYTSLVELFEWEDIRHRCRLQFTYYFDNNEELLSYVSMENALHIRELPLIIK
jgi:hypothetical protein